MKEEVESQHIMRPSVLQLCPEGVVPARWGCGGGDEGNGGDERDEGFVEQTTL